MSLFDDQLADFREPHAPFTGRNSLTDYKKKLLPFSINEGGGGGEGHSKKFRQRCSCHFFGFEI